MPTPPHAREKLDDYGIDAVCDDITNGQSLKAIARRLDMADHSLIRWIEADPTRSTRAWDARRMSAWHWDEHAEATLKAAKTHEQISKARELASHYRWRAGKLNNRYADKVDVHHSGTITLEALITRSLDTPLIAPTIEPQDDD